MLDDVASDSEIEQAKARGRIAGLRNGGQARECPHSFRRTELRRAWLDGFGVGRSQLRETKDGVEPIEDAPRRITYSLPLRCPRCSRTGTALASEIDGSHRNNIVFKVEALSPGFRDLRQGRSLGNTFIVCVACDVAAR